MDYSFLALQFLPFQCIQRVPYIVLQWGNGRSNLSDLKAYGRPRDKWRIHIKENSKTIWPFAHIPMYAGLRVISAYIRENRFKSCVWKIIHVFRDDIGNIKGTKMVHGVQRVCRGKEKAINEWQHSFTLHSPTCDGVCFQSTMETIMSSLYTL